MFRLVFLFLIICACESEEPNVDPAWVVESFIDRMQSVHGDPASGRLVLEVLSSGARRNLQERAERASAVSGRSVAPEEILVPSKFSLKFDPVSYGTEVRGKWSRVTVMGADATREVAEIRCVLENGEWKVDLDLPELPPIERREER